MNDLNDLMYRASDGDPNRPTDPMALLRQGHRRVHRRRGVTAVSGMAAASLAIAGGIAWLPGATPTDGTPTDGSRPDGLSVATGPTNDGDGEYEPVEVSREEVGERCTTVFHNSYPSDNETYVVPPREHGPWYEGQTAQVTSTDELNSDGGWTWSAGCVVPAAGLVDTAGTVATPLPDADDEDGIRAACGQYLGFDFAGWDVVTAAGTDITIAAALRSTNGYVATCELDTAPVKYGDSSWVSAIEREQPPRTEGLNNEYAVWFGADQYAGDNRSGDYIVLGVDQVAGPEEAAQVVITEPDGTEHVSEVADNGWFAIAEDLHLEMNPHGVSPLHITVLDADGNVLADYPDGEQSRECEIHPEYCEPED